MSFALTGGKSFQSSPVTAHLTKLGRRLRQGPLFRWRFSGSRAREILAEPADLHLADPNMAIEFYYGRYALGGRIVQSGAVSPFLVEPPSDKWEEALHDFSWLRHMDAARTKLAAAQSRSLVSDWMSLANRPIKGTMWRGDVVARRIISWLSHTSMLFEDAPIAFKKEFMRVIGFQIRYLRTIVAGMDDNEDRLLAHIALAQAAICHTTPLKQKNNTIMQLEKCLERQILPDGGHISRNPSLLVELLSDLMSLRNAYLQLGQTPPRALVDAIERMLPALRFFQHRDGNLARFNGVGPVLPQRLAIVLDLDESVGLPLSHAPHSGYQRLSSDQTLIIADTGYAPPQVASRRANAGCLSFEMSSGHHSFIINTGIDPNGPQNQIFLGRTTAAHSTATVHDTSSSLFKKNTGDALAPIIKGPQSVTVRRIEGKERNGFVASHDGYKREYNLIHERGIALTSNGLIIDGFDRFYSPGGDVAATNGRAHIAVRFHLHPDVEVSFDGGNNLRLEVLGGDAWTFSSVDGNLHLEDSIFFADLDGPRKTRQIVLSLRPCLTQKVRWRMVKIAKHNRQN